MSSSDDGAGDDSGSDGDDAPFASGADAFESGRHAMPRRRVAHPEPPAPMAPQQVWGMPGVQPDIPQPPAQQPAPVRIGFANRLPPLPR